MATLARWKGTPARLAFVLLEVTFATIAIETGMPAGMGSDDG